MPKDYIFDATVFGTKKPPIYHLHDDMSEAFLLFYTRFRFYTLNKNNITSPSFTMYSFPSVPTTPFVFAAERLPYSNKSL